MKKEYLVTECYGYHEHFNNGPTQDDSHATGFLLK